MHLSRDITRSPQNGRRLACAFSPSLVEHRESMGGAKQAEMEPRSKVIIFTASSLILSFFRKKAYHINIPSLISD